ncbi:MAG: glycoside hydrolase family 76 protein [Arachidicoccus sp.]|nr:glycoside hydrolase family 76 protein [Arachidicoccus sp.]
MKKYIAVIYFVLGGFCANAQNKSDNKQYFADRDVFPSYTITDTWAAYDAFNQYFFDKQTHTYKLNTDTQDGANTKATLGAVWTQATYWDMAMNAYKLAVKEKDSDKQAKYNYLVNQIFQGDSTHYVSFDWNNQDSQNGWFIYDDIMWWTTSFARAYGIFKDSKFLTLADQSFCRVWHGSYILKDRGSYDKKNGGMFWQWNSRNPPDNSDNGKMSCINFPTVVAAVTLYNNIPLSDRQHKTDDKKGFNGDPNYPRWHSRNTYLKNAKEIYEWGVNNLFDKSTGNIADNRHGNGVDWKATMYNQGAFIGASCMLYKVTGQKYYLDNAILAANYAMNVLSAPLYIFPYKDGEEQGIYTAIFAQYMNLLVNDCKQTQYLKWIQRTIGYGWSHRDGRGLTGKDYTKTPSSGISCYDASGIPALMLLFPEAKKNF